MKFEMKTRIGSEENNEISKTVKLSKVAYSKNEYTIIVKLTIARIF